MSYEVKPAPCSDEAFVVAWETAASLGEAAHLAGYVGKSAAKVASARAGRLRARGVRLRPFMPGPGAKGRSVKRLNQMAKRAREEVMP